MCHKDNYILSIVQFPVIQIQLANFLHFNLVQNTLFLNKIIMSISVLRHRQYWYAEEKKSNLLKTKTLVLNFINVRKKSDRQCLRYLCEAVLYDGTLLLCTMRPLDLLSAIDPIIKSMPNYLFYW